MTPDERAVGVIRSIMKWRAVTDRTPETEDVRRAALVERVRWGARHHDTFLRTIRAMWPHDTPTFAEAVFHTHEQLDAIADVLSQAEAELGIPF